MYVEQIGLYRGEMEHVIEQVENCRDLCVTLEDSAKFDQHIENVCKKVRQKCGWVLRTFYSRDPKFLRHINPTAHRLLLTAVDAPRRTSNGQNRRPAKELHSKDTLGETLVILGQAEGSPDELTAETIREV